MLIPEDDWPIHQAPLSLAHVMDGHPNAYDRFFFNGYTEESYFAVALGLYPNRGVIDGAFSLSIGDRQRSVFCGDALAGRPTAVGPLRVEILEPLRVNRVVVDAPDQGVRADLLYTARTVAFAESRQSLFDGPRTFLDVSRATQLGTWEGWIETPEGRLAVPAGTYGTKDRSWGVRPVGEPIPGAPGTREPQICFLWAPLNFPEGGYHFVTFDDASGRALSRTALSVTGLHGQPVHHDDSALSISHEPGTRRAASATLAIGGDTVALAPVRTFHMRGLGYLHPTYGHGRWHGGPFVDGELLELRTLDPLALENVHVQQVVRASVGGRTGLGVLEQLVIGPCAPMGLTTFLDGAQ